MNILEILSGLKNKVLDASTYDLLRRNFELLESNYQLTKDQNDYLKQEIEKLKQENLNLHGQIGGMAAEIDMLKGKI